MDKLDGKTAAIVDDNIAKLKELFPESFTEGKIDFEMLQKLLGENVETDKERYSFTWNGKSEAIKIALKQSTGTLRPDKESSKNWDTTENLYIEGDNLEVLRLLQNPYRGKVKMIYIDPPYNTGKDFVYTDKFNDTIEDYKERVGEGQKTNADTSGRYHTNWLNMMYPRLKLARNLLKDDGVIFISIDENEQHNLKLCLNEIFGEDNFLCEFVWKNKHGGGGDSPYAVKEHEYIICFAKNLSEMPELFSCAPPGYEKMFRESDNRGKFYFDRLDKKGIDSNRPNLIYPIECPDGSSKDISPAIWRLSKEEFQKRKTNNEIGFKKDKNGKWQVYTKTYLYNENGDIRRVKARSVLKQEIVGFTQNGNKEIIDIFGEKVFQNPKPTLLLKYLLDYITCDDKNEIILDFFSGSGSSAHAVMALNAENKGRQKFIMVQLPEMTYEIKNNKEIAKKESKEAYKAGYKTISEIGMERIRRAGDKIVKELKEKQNNQTKLLDNDEKTIDPDELDIGFKTFKLDTTNLSIWDEKTDDLEKTLLDNVDAIKDGRTEEDVLYEVLIKYGIDLTVPIKKEEVEGKKIYLIADGYLTICLEDNLDLSFIEKLAEQKPHRVVFRDNGFADDAVKTNAEMTLKKHGVEDIKVL